MKKNIPVVENGQPLLALSEPTKASRVINKFLIGSLLVTFIVLGVMFRWVAADETVLDIHNSPFPTRTIREHPTAGGVIIMTVDYCKNVDIEGKLRISFLSPSREIFQPLVAEKGPKGCQKTEVPILIPKDIPADTYKVKFRVIYDLNPLKRGVVQEFESQAVRVDPTVPTNDREVQ